MKHLYLIRHAEAAPADSATGDKDRPLTDRGTRDAIALGSALARRGYAPDMILCSPARRTRDTARAILNTFPPEGIVYQEVPRLYDAARSEILEMILRLDERYERVAVVGHNPAIYELSISLAGAGSDTLMHRLSQGFKPGSASVLENPVTRWELIHPETTLIKDLLDPLDYNAPASPTRWM